jgi:malate dehydrogenase
VGYAASVSGLPANKVVGMAGVLILRALLISLPKNLKVSISDINAFVLGGHGDTMVPVVDYTTISGIPLPEFVKMGWIKQLKNLTRSCSALVTAAPR